MVDLDTISPSFPANDIAQRAVKRAYSPDFWTLLNVEVEAAVDSSLMLADGEASDADRESWSRPGRNTRRKSIVESIRRASEQACYRRWNPPPAAVLRDMVMIVYMLRVLSYGVSHD